MSAEINQLLSIDAENFRVQTIGEGSYLNLIPPDKEISPDGAVLFSGKTPPFDLWLKKWNVQELEELVHTGMQCISRKLKASEKETFEALRAKMVRCKKYGHNYYENDLMDKI